MTDARAILLIIYTCLILGIGYKIYDTFLNPNNPHSAVSRINEMEHGDP